MTVPFWCVIVVAFLPYLLAGVGLYFRISRLGGWDNDNPRAQYAQLEGAGWRAWAAQLNAWEALGVFTAVVVITHLAGADPARSAVAAMLFVATRLLHPVLYIANLAWLRSATVIAGLTCCAYLVYLAAVAG